MNSLLIVEDEDMERLYLQKTVRSLLPASCAVYTAFNGQAALDLFFEHHPQVVFSDIYMPVMDGLTLSEHIKAADPETICYILTSYDYFSCAQKAIQIGIEDFILKPISRSGIQSVLNQADAILQSRTSRNDLIERIHSLEEKIEKDCFVSIVMSADTGQLAENLHVLGLSGQETCCAMACKDTASLSALKEKLSSPSFVTIGGTYENRCLLFVFSRKDEDFFAAMDELTAGDSELTPDLSAIAQGCSELIPSYHAMIHSSRRAMQNAAHDGGGMIESDLVCALARSMFEQAEQNLPCSQELLDETRTVSSDLPLTEFYTMLIEHLETLSARLYGERASFSCKPSSLTSPEIGARLIYRNLQIIISQKEQNAAAVRFRKATKYMESNFQNQILLEDVAKHLNMSLYSLSKLINASAKSNFSDLQHFYRTEEAKRLIREGYSLKQAAWMTGYHSQSYFSRTFKRVAGVSPKEYREIYENYLGMA